jgi:hypothetical protein
LNRRLEGGRCVEENRGTSEDLMRGLNPTEMAKETPTFPVRASFFLLGHYRDILALATQIPFVLIFYSTTGSIETTVAYELLAAAPASTLIVANELQRDGRLLVKRGEPITPNRIPLLKLLKSYEKVAWPIVGIEVALLVYAWTLRLSYFSSPILSVKLLTVFTEITIGFTIWPWFWRAYLVMMVSPRSSAAIISGGTTLIMVVLGFVTVTLASSTGLTMTEDYAANFGTMLVVNLSIRNGFGPKNNRYVSPAKVRKEILALERRFKAVDERRRWAKIDLEQGRIRRDQYDSRESENTKAISEINRLLKLYSRSILLWDSHLSTMNLLISKYANRRKMRGTLSRTTQERIEDASRVILLSSQLSKALSLVTTTPKKLPRPITDRLRFRILRSLLTVGLFPLILSQLSYYDPTVTVPTADELSQSLDEQTVTKQTPSQFRYSILSYEAQEVAWLLRNVPSPAVIRIGIEFLLEYRIAAVNYNRCLMDRIHQFERITTIDKESQHANLMETPFVGKGSLTRGLRDASLKVKCLRSACRQLPLQDLPFSDPVAPV